MIHLRELFQLFRHALPSPTPPRRVARRRLPLGVIAVATFASGCADPSSRLADEPTVVDIDWTDGRTEISNPEVFADEHDGPVVLRIIEDGEVVKEFAGATLAEARQELEQEVAKHYKAMASRPGASPAIRAFAELRESFPSDSSIMLMTDDQQTRLLAAMKPLLAEGYANLPAEEQATVISGVREAVNVVKSGKR